MRSLVYLLAWSAATFAASPPWLDAVTPLLKPGEKKAYLALAPAERVEFEANFWTGKSISPEEYFQRIQYIDANFGSGRLGSGANTDPGRVYLSIGAPVRIRRIPSSRIFVPLEIWYYDTVPGLLNTELRLIFYQKNSQGFLKLYSPELDTIRALLLPQAATIDTFGPNDSVSEATLRMNLNVPPAEDEVITAAVNVATGIKYSGNGEIIGLVLSPSAMLTRDLHTMVQSKLISAPAPRPAFLFGKSPFDAVQLDMALEVSAQWEVQLEVMEGPVTVYQNRLALNFDAAQPIQYLHRLDLLPGSYRLAIRIDGKTSYHPLEVPAKPPVSDVVFASETPGGAPQGTPFEFNGVHLYPSPDGRFALIALPQPSQVSWSIRRGSEVVWRQKTATATSVAVVPLPFDSLAPGKYQLEATAADETKRADLEIGPEIERKIDDKRTLVSFNANLTSTQRNAQVGHEWLLRGDTKRALPFLAAALRESPIKEVQVDLARVDALSKRWDQARDRLRPILAADPMNFEALCVYAYIEAQLQDYQVAAEYFQRALAVQDSPTIRLTLSQLPR